MSNIVPLTIKTVQNFSSSKFCVPAGVVVTAVVIQPVFKPLFKGWRLIRFFNLYKKPENHAQLAAGHGVNMAAGNRAIVKTSAICLHILAQIINCTDELQKIENALENIKKARRDHHIKQEPVIWQTKSKVPFISISRQIKIIHSGKNIALLIQIIAVSVLKVGKHTFLLTMTVSYLVHIFFLTEDSKNDSINEIFVNSAQVVDKLSSKKEYIITKLQNNENLISDILMEANSKLKASDIIETAKKKLKTVDNINQRSHNISKATGGLFKACIHNRRREILYDLGLKRFSPDPSPKVLECYANNMMCKKGDRFPPLEKITKPPPEEALIVSSDENTLITSFLAKKISISNLLKLAK